MLLKRHLTLKLMESTLSVAAGGDQRCIFDNLQLLVLKLQHTGAVVTGILTATSFEGSGSYNLPASGDANDITASLFT